MLVVSYQVRDLLRACLASLRAQRGVDFEVLILDNASADGSAGMVAAEFPEFRLERSERNVGFARANNRLAELARGSVVALVNPDTELPPGALAEALAALDRHERAGAVGVALVNPDGSPQPSCFAFPDPINLLVESLGLHRALVRAGFAVTSLAPEPRGGEGDVPWVSGACLVARRDVWEHTGGLDESLFMYGEEMEWCRRVHDAGHAVLWTNRTRVLHHGGASAGEAVGELFVRNLEGRMAFLRRHRGPLAERLGGMAIRFGVTLRAAYWRRRAAREGAAASEHTRAQFSRFEAARAWARGAAR